MVKWHRIKRIMWEGIDDDLQGLAGRIHDLASNLSHNEVREHVNEIRFFATTSDYECPFMREGAFDYYFSRKDKRLRSLLGRPRFRVLNPLGYETLPFTPIGFTSRYFQYDKIHHIHNNDIFGIEREFLEGIDREEVPVDFIDSLMDKKYNKTYDFVVHPLLSSVDEESQKRLAQKTVKAVAIWSTFINEILPDGKERSMFYKHWNAYMGTEGYAPDEAKAETFKVMKRLNSIRKLRPDIIFITGVDDEMFAHTIGTLSKMRNHRLSDFSISYPAYSNTAWQAASGATVYFANYIVKLLHFIIHQMVKDDPAYKLMEGWFQSLEEHPTQDNTRPYRKDNFKVYNRAKKSMYRFDEYKEGQVINHSPDYLSYGYNTHIVFLSDEGIWMDEFNADERIGPSYGQFIYKIELFNLEDVFPIPAHYRKMLSVLREGNEYAQVSYEELQKRFRFMKFIESLVVKERDEYYKEMEKLLPDRYLTKCVHV